MYCRLKKTLRVKTFFPLSPCTHVCFIHLLIACTQQKQLASFSSSHPCDALPVDLALCNAGAKYDFSEEQLHFESGPHKGDLAVNLALGATLLWLPLTAAAVGRGAFVKYRFTDKRISVITNAPWKKEQLDAAYQEVDDVQSVGRALGLWGDMVVTLKNGDKIEMRSLPKYDTSFLRHLNHSNRLTWLACRSAVAKNSCTYVNLCTTVWMQVYGAETVHTRTQRCTGEQQSRQHDLREEEVSKRFCMSCRIDVCWLNQFVVLLFKRFAHASIEIHLVRQMRQLPTDVVKTLQALTHCKVTFQAVCQQMWIHKCRT